ncbi:PadR family transcriptional regulator [Bacillus rhizoplanae]|uniref:PadR family transcriptional regulator n=1 Tax=Bacillus rhizoplanae TaxID=2880966 RepID=UPI003D1D6B98
MSMKLVILGLLLEGEKHPYEVQHIMKERQMDCYIKYAKGSLYYAFEQLEKQEAIAVTHIIRDTNRPDKTIYHITEKGKELFHTLLLEQFQAKNHIYKPIYTGLSFSHFGDNQCIVPILKKKIEETQAFITTMQSIYINNKASIPRAQLYILANVIDHASVEFRWLKQLYKDALEGKLSEIHTELDN